MITETQSSPEDKTNDSHPIPKRMIRLRPTQSLGERFPAMHLVRSSWFARVLSRLMFILLIGLILAGIFLPWQQTSRCEGEVVARLPQLRSQSVQSGTKGVIKKLKDGLREGMAVKEGDFIMEIEPFSKDQFIQLEDVKRGYEAQLKYSEDNQNGVEDQLKTERSRMNFELQAIDAKILASKEKVNGAKAKAKSQKSKFEQAMNEVKSMLELRGDTIPEIKFLEAKNKAISEEEDLSAAYAQELEEIQLLEEANKYREGKVKEIETKITELENKILKAKEEVQKNKNLLSEIKIKLGESQQLSINSPSTGIIQAIFGQAVAATVKEGDKLFEVIPDTADLAVELIVLGNDYPLISVGDDVRLQFEGWPAIQFVGWPSVAVGTFGGKVIAKNPSVDSKGDFKIIVSPDPNQPKWPDGENLRQGVRANGWVILRTVPLGFEVWRQLNGFPPGKSEPGTAKEKEKEPKIPKFK